MKGISDTVAVVTGGASGIGRATALRFAEAGASVAVVDVDEQRGEETADDVADAGVDAAFFEADVSEPSAVSALVDAVESSFGGIDHLHNNAAIEGDRAHLTEQTEESWDAVVDVDLKSVWLGMKYAMPLLERSDHGAIVNTGSTESFRGSTEQAPYVASKWGVVGLTRTAAKEFGPKGIRVNAVCPGAVETPMLERYTTRTEREETVPSDIPLGRMADASEIANAVVWLCSDEASYVTGQSLVVDGGRIA